ncbi:MAG: hypothetical protein Udaeo2_29500 [Candidatus Udaeobacter sp.]|nr:MAG: hypothetical protein Udaeo2_29500 [Candidatus Udaeobacter sp.]
MMNELTDVVGRPATSGMIPVFIKTLTELISRFDVMIRFGHSRHLHVSVENNRTPLWVVVDPIEWSAAAQRHVCRCGRDWR